MKKGGGDTGEGIFLGAKKRSGGGEGAWRKGKERVSESGREGFTWEKFGISLAWCGWCRGSVLAWLGVLGSLLRKYGNTVLLAMNIVRI